MCVWQEISCELRFLRGTVENFWLVFCQVTEIRQLDRDVLAVRQVIVGGLVQAQMEFGRMALDIVVYDLLLHGSTVRRVCSVGLNRVQGLFQVGAI